MIKAVAKNGTIRVKASAEGLQGASLTLTAADKSNP